MNDNYGELMLAFDRRYRVKKAVNLGISFVIAVLGITSFIFGMHLEPLPTLFRWMTVDGTLFTTVGAVTFLAVNSLELLLHTEMTRKTVYYLRLSSAVAESVIFIVVMFSQLPFFSEHLPLIDRYDSFVMHVVIPILCVLSFLTNDSPIGRLKPAERWHGTWFVTCYGAVILTLIGSRILPDEMIPYFFLDYRHYAWASVIAFVFIYGAAYLMSWLLSEWNRKLSWLWFKDVARRQL